MNRYFRPRRSMLYVPGCNARYLNKARTLRVDSVILDLGDPILVEKKIESRKLVTEAVLAGGYGRREVVVRVNHLESPWGRDDVKAVAGVGADALLFPNIESKGDVQEALAALDAANEVIEALEQAHRDGRGTVVVSGRLVEGHHVSAARRLLALADMIEKLEAGQ